MNKKSLALGEIGVAMLATLLAGGLSELGARFEIRGADAIQQIALFLVLMKCYPERLANQSGITPLLFSIFTGSLLGAVWILAVGLPNLGNTKFPAATDFSVVDIALGVLTAGVAAPLFEEKVVRQLMLDGLSRLVGRFASSLVTSAAFGLFHANSMLWGCFASLLLCFCALRLNMTSVQRAIAHGICNILILLWYLTGGLGLSG